MFRICLICHRSEGLDSHHIFPIALGGPKDGPQVLLCALCHRKVHTAANRVYSGKANFAEQFNADEFDRAKILIQSIVSAKIQLESSGRPDAAIRRLMIEIPSSLYIKLTRRKQDTSFNSMQDFLIAILEQAVK